MNWYKKATIENFKDRNTVNKHISELEKINKKLKYAYKIAIQHSSIVKKELEKLVLGKVLSSYPNAKKIISASTDKILDNPKQARTYMLEVIDIFNTRIQDLKTERKNFTKREDRFKGWK